MSGKPKDFLVSRQEKAKADDAAVFTWFGPPDVEDRFRFLVTKEDGDLLSILPSTEGRFKKGLQAWRWEAAEGGTPTAYVTLKTTPRRIDLRRVK